MTKKNDKVTEFIGPLCKLSRKFKKKSSKEIGCKKNIMTNNYLFARQLIVTYGE
jgi:hypothetical protein